MTFFARLCRPKELTLRLEKSRTRLYRVALSWSHDPSLADDLTQETLSKALHRLDQLQNPQTLESWLFRILTNCWRDHFRALRPHEDISEFEDSLYTPEDTPEHIHGTSQIVNRVRLAIARLPIGQRQVLTLIDLEEFSYSETAAILDIPTGTVMSRLCRARQELKRHLHDLQSKEMRPKLRRVV